MIVLKKQNVKNREWFHCCLDKMRKWKSWEAETRTLEYQFSNDPRRFLLIHQTTFARRHLRFWSEHRFLRWPACFLRQFYASVSKVDYFTLRHGFITAHFSEGSTFDFQKYIKRTLEKDFGVVVGISLWVWILSMLFIFLNAHDFYNYLWLPFIPLLMLLLVGTQLQGIISRMCLESQEKSQVVRGTFLVRPSDHFFWFGWPKLLLHLMHFILFQIMLPSKDRRHCDKTSHGSFGSSPLWICYSAFVCFGHSDGNINEESYLPRKSG
ncbi:hypothetical protein ERO13_A09G073900v2 [Gossypium hirsutum]|nr:hypothetical protein ERO13_A09G073900v2 [Gossypium hirsutum]